jgi:hypothetical protein
VAAEVIARRTAALAAALLAVAVAAPQGGAAPVAGGGGQTPAPKAPATNAPAAKTPAAKAPAPKGPQLERVRLQASAKELAGWRLDAEAEGSFALLQDDGNVAWLKAQPEPKWLERAERPLAEVPSGHLVAALEHAQEVVRDRCEELLVAQGPAASAALGSALLSPSVEMRRRALDVLTAKPAKQWKARVRERLNDDEKLVRRSALAAYAALQPEDLFTVCVDLLRHDGAPEVRHDVIGVLGRSGDVRAMDPLFEHLTGCEDRSLRLVTFDAFKRLTNMGFKREEADWRAWWENHRDETLKRAEELRAKSQGR